MSTDAFAPYKAQHVSLEGPGDARPTALQIVKDEDLLGKLSDKVVLVTGAASGIGIDTAAALHETGAKVYIAVRDVKRGQEVVDDILKKSQVKSEIEVIGLDLSDLDSVRKAAKEFLSKSSQLNLLINNAGVMAIQQRTLSKDGHEMQFATNHLGHFLLFQLLKPALLSSASAEFESRVVNVSSSGHRGKPVQFDDLTLKDTYSAWGAYGQSKTANIWMANEIFRRYGAQHLTANSLHPGGIFTALQRHVDEETLKGWAANKETHNYLKSTAQGAATTVWAALAKVWKGKGGKYLEDCSVAGLAGGAEISPLGGYAPHAYDPEGEKQLWKISSEIVGVEED